ncbi:DUF6973 domain-containing protein [Cloacibacterium rupense]|nr:hypothetical protein [Cloacibacterium rupense]
MKKLFSTIRIIFLNLKRLSFKNLFKLFSMVLSHPLFSILTFWATVKTYAISEKLFPITHSTDGAGNAFRHALWNCLIMMYCCKISSVEKSLQWAEKITGLHEDLFPNEPLQTKMDLHNNEIGRQYFMSLLPGIHRQFFETSFFVDHLLELTKKSVILESEGQEIGFNLVRLKEKRETLG